MIKLLLTTTLTPPAGQGEAVICNTCNNKHYCWLKVIPPNLLGKQNFSLQLSLGKEHFSQVFSP